MDIIKILKLTKIMMIVIVIRVIKKRKFLHKTIYIEILSHRVSIFIHNFGSPPFDIGFRRRIIAIPFTQNEYTVGKEKKVKKLLNQRISELNC